MAYQMHLREDGPAVARAAASEFRRRGEAAVVERGRFAVALSGGETPRLLFRELAANPAGGPSWEKIHLFWGDERTVPPDHRDSNFRMVRDELLSRVAIPETNVHRMGGENPEPEAAAAGYEAEIRRFFGLRAGRLPRFDLIFLGMGSDGHTASLFPGSAAVGERARLAVAPWVERLGTHRITLTLPVFNAAACVIFLVVGDEKAEVLRRVLEGPADPLELPCQAIAPMDGDLVWLVDLGAARLLSQPPPLRA